MPRSPSRDLADRYLGNRSYFRRFNRIEKWKWGLTAVALLAALSYVAAGFISRRTGDYRLTHGPLTNVHATWDADCAVCHVASADIKDNKPGLLRADQRWAELTCEKCHTGPAHFHAQYAADQNAFDPKFNACASCHHDHEGRTNSLVKISDDHCTRCHADPAIGQFPRHREADQPPPSPLTVIRNFSAEGGHPNMRVLEAATKPDRGKPHQRGLKFSHALHMTAGVNYPGLPPRTMRDFKDRSGEKQYAKYADPTTGVLQLDCYACHQLDSGLLGKDIGRPDLKPVGKQKDALDELLYGLPRYALRPPRGNGDTFLPVSYDLHCKTCHPNAPSQSGKATRAEIFIDGNIHRVQPDRLYDIVEQVYSATVFLAADPDAKGAAPAAAQAKAIEAEVYKFEAITLDEPKKAPAPANPRDAADERIRQAGERAGTNKERVAELVRRQMDQFLLVDKNTPIRPNCTKCHVLDGYPGRVANESVENWKKKLPAARILPTNSPNVWFANAKFNHAAHRGTTCQSCHPGTFAPGNYTSWKIDGDKDSIRADEKSDPTTHLPNIDECRKCHAPATTKDGQPVGGVRSGCVECHRYHNGEHPLQGRGAGSRNPAHPYDKFPEFLGGKPSGKTP